MRHWRAGGQTACREGAITYWDRVHGLLGRSKGPLRRGEQPVGGRVESVLERASGLKEGANGLLGDRGN